MSRSCCRSAKYSFRKENHFCRCFLGACAMQGVRSCMGVSVRTCARSGRHACLPARTRACVRAYVWICADQECGRHTSQLSGCSGLKRQGAGCCIGRRRSGGRA
eukprot:2077959-Pleurochrysis_carterae.AAC.2